MFDVVIIGSGAAGLSAALSIDSSLKILVLSANTGCGANTKLAQGGIAATYEQTKENIDLHIDDTLKAGCGVNDFEATKLLVEQSKDAIDFLISHGTKFDKVDGEFDLTAEGVHSIRRIFHADGDSTGKVIYESLLNSVNNCANITILDQAVVYKCESIDKQTYRIAFKQNEQSMQITTNNLIISSGGYANLFSASSNAKYINGINLIIGQELKLKMSNLHLVQFHPTGFKDNDGQYHLLTESLRGEGARFYSHETGYFMSSYHPLGDVAPRDITSRAVLDQHHKGHQVYLDCSLINAEIDLEQRFNTVSQVVSNSGYNLRDDLIPVVPVAHYCIGGIDIDMYGQTNRPGVYAIGEAAMSGVHGANRLASNSLLECVVYGINVAKVIHGRNQYPIEPAITNPDTNLNYVYQDVRNILSNSCNIIRTDEKLTKALEQLKQYQCQSEEQLAVINVGIKIVDDCLRHASIGCHYKENNDPITNHQV